MWCRFIGLLCRLGPLHVQWSVPYSGTLSGWRLSQCCTSLASVYWPSRHRGSQERKARKVSYWKLYVCCIYSSDREEKSSAMTLKLTFIHFIDSYHALLIAAMWHNLIKSKRTAHSRLLRQTHPKIYASLWLSTSWATICSPLLFSPWLPTACGHNTAHRQCSTQCTVVRTTTRPAGSSPSSSPTSGRTREQSRMGRKIVWRGHWLLSGPTLPERTEVGPMPNTQAQVRVCQHRHTMGGSYWHNVAASWLPKQRCNSYGNWLHQNNHSHSF